MKKLWRWAVLVSVCCLAAGIGIAAWHELSKPTTLTLAVGPHGLEDATLAAAWSRALVAEKASIRLALMPTSGPEEALEKLKKGEAQLAVARSDGVASDRVRAVAILHKDPVVIVTPTKNKLDDFGDLKGKVLGVIGPPSANDALLATLQRHYRVTVETKAIPPVPAAIADAIRSRQVSAILFVVPTTRGTTVRENWAAVARASRRQLTFIALDDAEAIAAAAPAYEAGEIAGGQFGGSPTLPEESVTTIDVTTFLLAQRDVPKDAITALIRSLFEARRRIASDASITNLMEAASTDKEAYYDSEETTFMERHGDWLFYGPMLFGALGTLLVATKRFLGLDQSDEPTTFLPQVGEMITSITQAKTTTELDELRSRIDAAVAQLAAQAARGNLDPQRSAAIALVVNYLDHLLSGRRKSLLSQAGDPAFLARAAGQQ